MNIQRITVSLLGIFFSGCVVTTTTQVVEMERVDQQISTSANRGYLIGTPAQAPATSRAATRQVIRTDIELPTLAELNKPPRPDEEVSGNRGYVTSPASSVDAELGSFVPIEEPMEEAAAERIQSPGVQEAVTELQPLMQASQPTPTFEEYVVQKGDTLQIIAAKSNIYGRPSKWVKIYDANRDVIEDPNKIKPGMRIKIPRD